MEKNRKAVDWLNRKYYPKKGNHFKLIAIISIGVVVVLSVMLMTIMSVGIDLYFSSMRTQLYLIYTLMVVVTFLTVWYWIRKT